MATNSIKPFELLNEYERLSLQHKVARENVGLEDQWSGVGFIIGDKNYLLSIGIIVEVILLTETTKIPGIAPWVLGLGNIRGNLMPVIDLKYFLFNTPTKTTAHTRMIVVQQIGGQVGLIVDEVAGQKHFNKKDISKKAQSKDALEYSETFYKDEDEKIWNVLEDELLINNPKFQNAAAI